MKMDCLRVMTFNIHRAEGMNGKTNLHNIALELRRSKADIVALQEVDRFLPRSGLKDQVVELAALLGMAFCYSASEEWDGGQYGNATLSRFPIIHNHFRYLESPIERRSLLTAVIQIGEYTVTVLNTHLGLDQQERKQQMKVIHEALQTIDGAIVLMGDFNMEPDNPLLQRFPPSMRKVFLREQGPTIFNVHDSRGEIEIDHIFTNMAAETAFAWTQPTQASDHYPVITQLELRS